MLKLCECFKTTATLDYAVSRRFVTQLQSLCPSSPLCLDSSLFFSPSFTSFLGGSGQTEGQTFRLSLHPAFLCPAARHKETKGLSQHAETTACRQEEKRRESMEHQQIISSSGLGGSILNSTMRSVFRYSSLLKPAVHHYRIFNLYLNFIRQTQWHGNTHRTTHTYVLKDSILIPQSTQLCNILCK